MRLLLLQQRIVFGNLLLRHHLLDLVRIDAQHRVVVVEDLLLFRRPVPLGFANHGLHFRRQQRHALVVEPRLIGSGQASMAAFTGALFRLNSSSFWPLAKISAGVASMTLFSTSGSKIAFMA